MTHRNAVLTPRGRNRLVMRVQAGRPIAHVAAEAGIARATLSKWVARHRQGRVKHPGLHQATHFPCPPRPTDFTGSSTQGAESSSLCCLMTSGSFGCHDI